MRSCCLVLHAGSAGRSSRADTRRATAQRVAADAAAAANLDAGGAYAAAMSPLQVGWLPCHLLYDPALVHGAWKLTQS